MDGDVSVWQCGRSKVALLSYLYLDFSSTILYDGIISAHQPSKHWAFWKRDIALRFTMEDLRIPGVHSNQGVCFNLKDSYIT